jgi:antitoxin component YwqK of YwqJK toxin-antitoxin module
MRLVWVAFTGALMLLFVLVTHQQQMAAQDPPGVVTRWWDGTKQSVEEYYDTGKLYSRTEYGEDGKTVLLYKQWSRTGVLEHQLIRLKDGKLEEKKWHFGGRTLSLYRLWLGDESSPIIEQTFYADGVMATENVKTEDGMTFIRQVTWDSLGRLVSEYHIRDNASHERKEYVDGRLETKRTDYGTGDWEEVLYWDNGNQRHRTYYTKLTGKLTEESFNKDGTPASRGPNQMRGD